MTIKEPSKQFRPTRMRRKVSTGTGCPVQYNFTDGNQFTVTFGAPALDGDYTTTITPADSSYDPIVVTTTRAGGVPATPVALAVEHVADINALLSASDKGDKSALAAYVEQAITAGNVVGYIAKRNAPRFTVGTTAPGGSTLTLNPDDTFPITVGTLGWRPQVGPRTHLHITMIPCDSNGTPLEPGTLVADIDVFRYFDRGIGPSGVRNDRDIPSTPVGVERLASETAYAIGEALIVPGGPGRYGVCVGATAGAPGLGGVLDHLEVWLREVTN